MNYYEMFKDYLTDQRKLSDNTVISYLNDLNIFEKYCLNNKIELLAVTKDNIVQYLKDLEKEGRRPSTIYRALSVIKCFYSFIYINDMINTSPAEKIVESKRIKTVPKFVTKKDIDKILSMPELTTDKGKRDKAIISLMFFCGLKVSEILNLKVNDVNFNLNIIRINEPNKKFRVVPFNNDIKTVLYDYIHIIRNNIINEIGIDSLFINMNGQPISRQGIWKIIKYYSITSLKIKNISPEVIRNSYIIYSLQNGLSSKELMERLGYSDNTNINSYVNIIKNTYSNIQ